MNLPRKRRILAWHRWMGLISALFLVVLSITGLALNHTERLKLDQIQIRYGWVLAQYGMAGGEDIAAYRIRETDTLAHLDGQLFYNGRPLAASSPPLGIVEDAQITVIATTRKLIYLTAVGELIEIIDHTQLPYDELTAVGRSLDQRPVLIAREGNWNPDADWLDFDRYQAGYSVDPLPTTELSEAATAAILDAFQGGGVSLYRVLLDLHSGRLFGWGGRTLMDLTAVAILLLVTSGIGGWLRKSRRPNKPLSD